MSIIVEDDLGEQGQKPQDPPEHCAICFQSFERGQQVTFLPCQFNRLVANHTSNATNNANSNNLESVFTPNRPGSKLYGSLTSLKGTTDRFNRPDSEADFFIANQRNDKIDMSHFFHAECIVGWFNNQTHCPICNFWYGAKTARFLRQLDPNESNYPPAIRPLVQAFVEMRQRCSLEVHTFEDKHSMIEENKDF